VIFGLWPTCAKEGCGALGLFKFKFMEAGREFVACLCFDCLKEVSSLFSSVAQVRAEDRELLNGRGAGEIIPREDEGPPQALTG